MIQTGYSMNSQRLKTLHNFFFSQAFLTRPLNEYRTPVIETTTSIVRDRKIPRKELFISFAQKTEVLLNSASKKSKPEDGISLSHRNGQYYINLINSGYMICQVPIT